MAAKEYSRSSHIVLFLGKRVLKICSKFTGEHPCRSVSLINCTSTYGCSPLYKVCCMQIFRTHFPKSISEWLLLICRLVSKLSSCLWNEVNLGVVETNEAKIIHKTFHDMLERVVGVKIKCHITFFREQIKLRGVNKKEVENTCLGFWPWTFPLARAGFPLCYGSWES